jgi:hypothetical protein
MAARSHVLASGRFLCVLLCLLAITWPAKASAAQPVEHTFAIPSSASPGIRAYLSMEMSPLLWDVIYQYGQSKAAANGAYGPNVTAPRSNWFLEYQRAGGQDVIAGVLRNDPGLIQTGLSMFHFGLARQAKNGSFPGSFQPFHGTALFLAEAAPSLIVLENSPLASRFTAEIGWEVPRMRRAEYHMVRSVGGAPHIDDATKNHRWFEEALALQATGILSNDRTLQSWAKRYAARGIKMARPDGVMPEDGGHDSGYQALGLTFATRYLALIGGESANPSLDAVVKRGEAWELSRVRPDGTINQSGDTRTAGCQERDPQGRCKSVFLATIFNALARWAVLANDKAYRRVALTVWLQNWASQPGDVLPAPGLFAKPSTLKNGEWVTVSGTRFQPLERVRVYLDQTLIQTVKCDQIGSFGGHSPVGGPHFPIQSLAPGTHTIVGKGSLGTVRKTTITVTA